MQAITRLVSSCIALPESNIDTDQIIPARFLTATSFAGLGQHAFADWRFDGEGNENPDCPLNDPLLQHRQILVAGNNFGCGSSREHAPRALYDFGFRVVISQRIADIFKNNAAHCGLLAIELNDADVNWLLTHPDEVVLVDLEKQFVEFAEGHRCTFSIDSFARHCLMRGQDPLDFICSHSADITAHEQQQAAPDTSTMPREASL